MGSTDTLDRLPQREQSEAKDLLRAVVYAPIRAEAVKAREVFARRYRPWYPKAVDVLEDDWERMVRPGKVRAQEYGGLGRVAYRLTISIGNMHGKPFMPSCADVTP